MNILTNSVAPVMSTKRAGGYAVLVGNDVLIEWVFRYFLSNRKSLVEMAIAHGVSPSMEGIVGYFDHTKLKNERYGWTFYDRCWERYSHIDKLLAAERDEERLLFWISETHGNFHRSWLKKSISRGHEFYISVPPGHSPETAWWNGFSRSASSGKI